MDWYPWCDEAFRRAKELDRPILLSSGYSTCHWCHVMERESFGGSKIQDVGIMHIIKRYNRYSHDASTPSPIPHIYVESDRIARLLNERFVPIKVDREERPDVDAVYMQFIQAATGGGGWTMVVHEHLRSTQRYRDGLIGMP